MLRQVLKIAFAVFLAFSWAGFAYFLKEHSAPCFLKEKAKDVRQKHKDGEEQYKEQRLNLCGEFLEHALRQLVKKRLKRNPHVQRNVSEVQ